MIAVYPAQQASHFLFRGDSIYIGSTVQVIPQRISIHLGSASVRCEKSPVKWRLLRTPVLPLRYALGTIVAYSAGKVRS